MRNLNLLTLLAIAGASVACSGSATGPAESHPVGAPEATSGTLTASSVDDTLVSGTYELGTDKLVFEAKPLADGSHAVTVKLHGLTLLATLDTKGTSRTWTQDGFATANGESTSMVEEDVALIGKFVKSLEANHPDVAKGEGLAHHFDSVMNYWAMWIPAMSLKNAKFEDKDRATNLCYYAQDANGYYTGSPSAYRWMNSSANWAGHDCGGTWLGGSNCNGDPLQGGGKNNCSSVVQLGDHNGGGTLYWVNSAWTTSGQDHKTMLYEQGDCYGRYGADCGSGTSYNQESLSHDQCVRNGHNIASSWCSDELSHTTDSTGNCY